MSLSQTAAVGTTITRGGQAANTMSQQSSPGTFDVWTHSYDGLANRMQSGNANTVNLLSSDPAQLGNIASAASNMQSSSLSQVGGSMSAQAGALGNSVNAIAQADGALQTVGATFAMLTSVEQMLSSALSFIPFPAFPALRIADFDIGLPHAHSHPPNLIPPAPPIPLPSTGPVIPIPILSGATQTLINNMPAARCGDMGLGVWCGGYFPMYEVFLGSSNVWIEGARAARLLVDITKHCMFTVPKPSDPPLGPMIGTTISASPNVLIGGIPMPSLTSLAMGAAMKGAFKLAGKGAKAFGRLTAPLRRRLASHLDDGFIKCKLLRAEPVNFATGEVVIDQQDYEIPGRLPIAWNRHYGSHSSRRGVCGYGWSTTADARLVLERDGAVLFYDGLGGAKIFPYLPSNGVVQEFVDGATLEVSDRALRVRLKDGLAYVFVRLTARSKPAELLIHQLEDRCGNFLRYVRDESGLCAILESAGRRLEIKSEQGLIREMSLGGAEGEPAHLLVRYEYSEAGELLAVYDAIENPYRFHYDRRRLVQHTDRNGLSFYYAYDSDKQSARCHHSWGDGGLYNYRFEYDPSARRVVITNSLGGTSTIQLSELNLPLWEIDPLGRITRYEYDDRGRTLRVIAPGGLETGYEYDERGNFLKITRPDGKCVELAFNAENKPVSIVDPMGAVWQQQWDERGLLRARVTALGHTSKYEYDAYGQLTASVDPLGARTELSFDRFGNLVRLQDALGHTTRYEYDGRGNLTSQSDPLDRQTTYRYDAKDRLLSIHLPSGACVKCAYDGQDNLVRYVDENGAETRLEYFGLGELAGRIQPDGHRLQYHYDTEERLIGVTNQRGETYRLRRDALGRITEEVDYWGQSTTISFDDAGHLRQSRDPLGRVISFQTDELGRIRAKRFAHPIVPGGTFEETFDYDANDQLIACANEHAKVQRRFDAEGRLLEERQNEFVVRNTYDALGRRLQRETSAGNTVRYEYDPLGRPTTIRINDDPPVTIDRDAAGQVLRENIGSSVERCYSYNTDGRVTAQALRRGGASLFETQYEYDATGNLTQRRDSAFGVDIYRYDPLGQVVEHIDPQGRLAQFLHDPAGDRFATRVLEQQTSQVVGGEALSLWSREGTYEGIRYVFDRAGNLVERSGTDESSRSSAVSATATELTWNANQRLVRSRSDGVETTYGYDPLGRRVLKRTGERRTRFRWDGDAMFMETTDYVSAVARIGSGATADAGPAREYVYYPGTFVPLALIEGDRESYHYYSDPSGCPTRLTRGDGAVVWAASYDLWGQARPSVHTVSNPLRLQGQYLDEETGLHYNRYRYYDPAAGAFISQDPIRLFGGAQVYRYASNALTWIDPLGLMCAARAGRNFDSDFYKNQYRRVTRDELMEADPFTRSDGKVLPPHPNKHSMSKAQQVDVLNNWEKSFTGVNYNGRPVDIYWKDGSAVVTQAGEKNKIITAYDSVDPTRWSDPSRWKKQADGFHHDEAYHGFNRNQQR